MEEISSAETKLPETSSGRMKSDEEIIRMFQRQKSKHSSKQRTNTIDCQAFYAGDFMSYTDRLQYADGKGNKKSVTVQFNYVKPYVNGVRGFMAQTRRIVDYIARHPNAEAQEVYSSYSNHLRDYVREKANADQIETQQDGDMLICGVGLVETALSYGEGHSTTNPNGEVIMGRIDPRDAYWDNAARAPCLLDARWIGYSKVHNLDDALSLFDGSKPEDFESTHSDDQDAGNRVYFKRGGIYNKIQELYDVENEKEELIRVYFHQWFEIEPFYRCKNPLKDLVTSGIADAETAAIIMNELQEIAAEQEEPDGVFALKPDDDVLSMDAPTMAKVKKLFEMVDAEFDKFKRKVYYTAILSGNTVFKKFRNADQSGFTIKAKTGDYDDGNKIWVGMVNALRDPALYANKALTELLLIVASQAKGGVMYERGAIQDIASFEAKWAKTDSAIMVEDGALQKNMIKPKKEGFQPTGVQEIIALSQDALPLVSGIDKTFLGSSENKEETGVLQRQRIKQVTATLATYFDSISLYQKKQAELLLTFMRIFAENNDGELFEAMGEDGKLTQYPISSSNFVERYGIALQEAPDTATQKAEKGAALMEMAKLLMATPNPGSFNAGLTCLAQAVKLMPLDFADRQTIIQALLPMQGQKVDASVVVQLQNQVKQLMSEGNKAAILEKLGKAHKSQMEGEAIISEIAERRAKIPHIQAETQKVKAETRAIGRDPAPQAQV